MIWVALALPLLAAGNAAAPRPAIAALVEAFRTHAVVAIGELHGNRQAGDFYIALVRDPGFQRVVNDIVVEFASGQSQSLLDRYVVAGDSIPADSLQSIWRNTTKVAAWDFPTYARWLAAIRDANRQLPTERRIRVLAGDTPVDWRRLHTPGDWTRLGDNNESFSRVIGDEVIAKHRKALVVLGNNHLARGGTFRDRSPNTTTRVNVRAPGSIYVALIYYGGFGDEAADARISSEHWPTPAVTDLSDSWIGQRGIATSAGTLSLATFADALLYLGPRSDLVEEHAPASYYDAAYRRELERRALIEWGDSSRLRLLVTPLSR